MIVGHGIDLVAVPRIDALLRGPLGARFVRRCFVAREFSETDLVGLTPRRVTRIAALYALKEAVAKALGVGIGAHCGFHDIERGYSDHGAPEVILRGAALVTFHALARRAGASEDGPIPGDHLVSISHEGNHAIASVILCQK